MSHKVTVRNHERINEVDSTNTSISNVSVSSD